MISATSGLWLDSIWKSTAWRVSIDTVVAALTVAERGSPVTSAISPKKLPGPSSIGVAVAMLTRPSTMKNIWSPRSPLRQMTAPAGSGRRAAAGGGGGGGGGGGRAPRPPPPHPPAGGGGPQALEQRHGRDQ